MFIIYGLIGFVGIATLYFVILEARLYEQRQLQQQLAHDEDDDEEEHDHEVIMLPSEKLWAWMNWVREISYHFGVFVAKYTNINNVVKYILPFFKPYWNAIARLVAALMPNQFPGYYFISGFLSEHYWPLSVVVILIVSSSVLYYFRLQLFLHVQPVIILVQDNPEYHLLICLVLSVIVLGTFLLLSNSYDNINTPSKTTVTRRKRRRRSPRFLDIK